MSKCQNVKMSKSFCDFQKGHNIYNNILILLYYCEPKRHLKLKMTNDILTIMTLLRHKYLIIKRML